MTVLWEWTVPANLLLLGEYAVTVPGGHGLSVAVEPRARSTVFLETAESDPGAVIRPAQAQIRRLLTIPSDNGDDTASRNKRIASFLRLTARSSGEDVDISPGNGHDLVDAVMDEVCQFFQSHRTQSDGAAPSTATSTAPRLHAVIDTSGFFAAATGKKLGLGSSAAATLLVTATLFQAGGIDPVRMRDAVIATAIRSHRRAHGGRGSGYDIATSGLGGVVHFEGGATPRWTSSPLGSRWNQEALQLFGWPSGVPVGSSGAVRRFGHYIPAESTERRSFVRENNRLVSAVEEAKDWNTLFEGFTAARRLGENLGAQIGVPATVDVVAPHRDDGWVMKASGAGNERVVVLAGRAPRRPVPRPAQPLEIARRGLSWEYRFEDQT